MSWDFERVLTAFLTLTLLKGWKYEVPHNQVADISGDSPTESVAGTVVLDSAQKLKLI